MHIAQKKYIFKYLNPGVKEALYHMRFLINLNWFSNLVVKHVTLFLCFSIIICFGIYPVSAVVKDTIFFKTGVTGYLYRVFGKEY